MSMEDRAPVRAATKIGRTVAPSQIFKAKRTLKSSISSQPYAKNGIATFASMEMMHSPPKLFAKLTEYSRNGSGPSR